TAKALKGDRERCIEAGMDDYLSKPVRLEDLRSTIAKWIAAEPAAGRGPAVGHASAPAAPAPTATPLAAVPGVPTTDAALAAEALDRLRALAGDGQAEFLTQLFGTYLEDSATRIAAIRDAAAAGDAVRVRAEAHALKGASLSVGATTLGAVAREIETWG